MSEQKVKTSYGKDAKKEEVEPKHHEERRALNRKLRSQQEPALAKVKRAAGQVRGAASSIASSPAVQKVGGFLKDRSIAIAQEMRGPPSRGGRRGARKQNYGEPLPGIHQDPFGVGGFGGMNADPWNNPMHPQRKTGGANRGRILYDRYGNEVVIKPKRRKKRAPAQPRQSGGMQMMGIPKNMRWMF